MGPHCQHGELGSCVSSHSCPLCVNPSSPRIHDSGRRTQLQRRPQLEQLELSHQMAGGEEVEVAAAALRQTRPMLMEACILKGVFPMEIVQS